MNNKYIRLPDGNKLACYDIIVNNLTYIFKFIDMDLNIIKNFFGTEIINYVDILDENENLIHSYDIYAKRSEIICCNEVIKVCENRLVQEAWDETSLDVNDEDEINQDGQVIHHPAVYEQIEKDVTVDIIKIIMSKPSVEGEIENLKTYVGVINPNNMTLEEFKRYYVSISNDKLKEYLAQNPLVSNCHNGIEGTYNITKEKQDLMTSNYLTYTIKKAIDPDTVLTWNESGEECEVWTEQEFLHLIIEIESVVKPLVSKQQSIEKEIMDAKSINALKEINIDYRVADIRNLS